jgi:hypothetical protein
LSELNSPRTSLPELWELPSEWCSTPTDQFEMYGLLMCCSTLDASSHLMNSWLLIKVLSNLFSSSLINVVSTIT